MSDDPRRKQMGSLVEKIDFLLLRDWLSRLEAGEMTASDTRNFLQFCKDNALQVADLESLVKEVATLTFVCPGFDDIDLEASSDG
jgi:hypothetical protein